MAAAVISYRHAYELVRSHGETGTTARLVPFTVDGLIRAASMVMLDASRRKQPAPPLAKWSLAVGTVATVGANKQRPTVEHPEAPRTDVEQTKEQAVLAEYLASLDGPGRPVSQRYLAEKHNIDRRKVKQIISTVVQR